MMQLRRWTAGAALLAACVFALIQPAGAAYPDKVITMIVSVPPGAGVDMMGRTLAERLGPRLGQTIVVENKPGASSMVAAAFVAKAPPDGYTLLFAPDTMLMAAHVLPKGAAGGVNLVRDLVPVMITSSAPMVIVVNPSLGVTNVQQYLDFARRNPGLTYGTSGTGSHFHIAGLLLERSAGVQLTHVPYKGIAEALTGLLGGQIQSMVGVPSGVVAKMIEAGRVVPLAVLQEKRSALLPNVPTLGEAGVRGLEKDVEGSLFILAAPAGTPRAILSKLNDEGRAALSTPEAQQRMTAIGMEPVGTSLDEAIRQVRDQYERNGRLVKEFGVQQ
jgi:tripartite-type tricarboxylate transporter receptor subunit TctC